MAIKSYIIRGKARWAKILGKAPPGYDNGPAEWSIDLYVDDDNKQLGISNGIDPFYFKESDNGEVHLRFTRKAVKQDGTEAKPIRVIDHKGEEWDQTKLIGNDSVLNVSYTLNEVKSKGKKRLKPSVLAIQVWDHAKYKPKSEFPVREDISSETTDQGEDW